MMTVLGNTRAWMTVGGILLAIAIVIFLIDRLFAWLAKNGAKAMRNDKAGGGGRSGMGNLLGTFEGFLRPEKQMVLEEREQRKAVTGETDPSNR